MRYLALLLIVGTAYADTTCTTNSLGDRTCVTTTGNILSNSTFGSSNTTTTTGWLTTGSDGIHTHGNFGTFPYGANMDQTGGVLAFEGYVEDNVFQDSALVKHGHLTQSQINEGFTSTLSADVWFWNSIENTLTLKQTITGADGSVTTQSRTINDNDPTRNSNGGMFTNYTDSYIQSPNSQTDITIRAELYNLGDGTNNDNYHRGPDVDNVQLSITTLGETTSCQQLNTCTSVGTELTQAFDEIDEIITANIEIVEFEPVEEITFIPFEEPEIVMEMFSEVYVEEIAVEEISAGVVNVFTLAPSEEIIEMSSITAIETFDELPAIGEEIRYDSQENFSEVATEIQIEESFFEATESFDNQGTVEGIQEIANFFAEEPIEQSPAETTDFSGGSEIDTGEFSETNEASTNIERVDESRPAETETVATSQGAERPTMGGANEQESPGDEERLGGETRPSMEEEPPVQNDTAPIEDERVADQPQEEDTIVAEEEVSNETVGETETRDSNEGDETTEVADASTEDNQSTPDAVEESRSEGTTARPTQTVSIENIEKKVNETIKRVDQRLIATSLIAAKAMQSKISVDNYGNTNSEMFNSQPQIDGGNYYETRQYIDARNLYAQNQNVYDDPVTKYQKNVQEKVDERIRAEEHLRRIRGY
jgi:hypothetical protein